MTSQSQPVTPVRVPKAAIAYTPTTQDPDLRSQINAMLIREGHLEKIEHVLHHALHAHPSNWPSRVSLHALSLLRSGECTTFPTLMERVLADIRRDTEAARLDHHLNPSPTASAAPSNSSHSTLNNSNTTTTTTTSSTSSPEQLRKAAKANSVKGKVVAGDVANGAATAAAAVGGGSAVNGAGSAGGSTGLAVPQTVIEEGVRITRECLEQVCEIDD